MFSPVACDGDGVVHDAAKRAKSSIEVNSTNMTHLEHEKLAPRSVTAAIITISDTRTPATDTGGQRIRELLEAAGHAVCSHAIVRDDPDQIRTELRRLGGEPACQAILLTGGTGISARDQTYETVSALLEKRLEGFGELFRMLSFQEIGPAAMLSRAIAGVFQGRVLFSMPGSPNAVNLAMTRLIVPQLGHLAFEMSKQGGAA